MKTFRSICLALVACAIIKVVAFAGDAKSTASFIDSITVAPVAALKTEGLDGASTFGAGVDLGVGINKFVSIHGTAIAFEDWRGGAVDESEIYGKATFARFANEAFTLYGKGGVVYDFGGEELATSLGAGAELKINKRLALAADYSVRAWFSDREKDSLARALISISF